VHGASYGISQLPEKPLQAVWAGLRGDELIRHSAGSEVPDRLPLGRSVKVVVFDELEGLRCTVEPLHDTFALFQTVA
jgi:hypothetical protein